MLVAQLSHQQHGFAGSGTSGQGFHEAKCVRGGRKGRRRTAAASHLLFDYGERSRGQPRESQGEAENSYLIAKASVRVHAVSTRNLLSTRVDLHLNLLPIMQQYRCARTKNAQKVSFHARKGEPIHGNINAQQSLGICSKKGVL